MKNGNIKFGETASIVTYDLSPCNISAEDICEENSKFKTYHVVAGVGIFDLPNTTLITNLTKEEAENQFKKAIKNIDPDEKITKLFIFNVSGRTAFIENNE